MAYLNLYPPVINTYMPAFINTGNCKVYFSLSSYNNFSDIKYAQVSIVYQNSNLSALRNEYKNDIKVCDIYIDENKKDSNQKYYIVIEAQDLAKQQFEINTYYKVQIRFTHQDAESLSIREDGLNAYAETAGWLANNLDHFSEWSTVCLIRGISQPTLKWAQYIEDGKENFTSKTLRVLGNFTFKDKEETEVLSSYQLFLKNYDSAIIEQTEKIYTNILNPNVIDYTLNTLLEKNKDNDKDYDYELIIKYTTRNLYEHESSFKLKVSSDGLDFENLQIEAFINYELDAANIVIDFNSFQQQDGDIFWIKRTSVKSNFKKWEYVHEFVNSGCKQIKYVWNDYSIESGIWYKYALEVNRENKIIDVIIYDKPILAMLENIYLMRNYRQLSVSLNPQISSYQRVINDTVTSTLGSKYPFIGRNGNTNYRQFSINGLISSEMDENGIFTSKDEIYQLNKTLYNQFNYEHRISPHRDYQYEYNFREKVLDFLYDEQPKLFRSPTEGNMIVKLTNINLTPNQTLGRLLYSFSATIIEVDDCTPENLMKYGIFKTGSITDLIDNAFFFIYEHNEKNETTIIPPESLDGDALVISTFSSEI